MALLKIVCLAGIAASAASPVRAQGTFARHERSAAPAEARYEVVQSALVARSTYRVDKALGQVDQLVMREDSTLRWQPIPRRSHPAGDPRVAARPNYQLFMSGIANRHTFLINTNNGATWQLVLTKEETLAWDPLS